MSRPPSGAAVKRANPPIQFYPADDDERAAFIAEAERVGLSLSAWFRQLGRRAAGLPSAMGNSPPPPPEPATESPACPSHDTFDPAGLCYACHRPRV